MADKHQVRLGAVQETLFITLAARAAETQRKHPVLRDPKAVELLQSIDYDECCPNARTAIASHLMVYLHEGWTDREVDDLARALRKVEDAFRR